MTGSKAVNDEAYWRDVPIFDAFGRWTVQDSVEAWLSEMVKALDDDYDFARNFGDEDADQHLVHRRSCSAVRWPHDIDPADGAAHAFHGGLFSWFMTEEEAREWLAADKRRRLCRTCQPQLDSVQMNRGVVFELATYRRGRSPRAITV
jgi:hypothetical protein